MQAVSYFDPEGNLHMSTKFYDENVRIMGGKELMYYFIITASHSPYKKRGAVREILGISRATEWRYRKNLKEKGYL